MTAVSRRVSYILPSPSDPPPLLSLPPLGERRRGNTAPNLIYKPTPPSLASLNPFAEPEEPKAPSHPRHCLGITSLALDTSTLLANTSSPGGILYTGGRDGLVASWELGIPHKRRRGGRYEVLPGRGGHKVKWERIGDGAEMWSDDEDDMEDGERSEDLDEDEGYSSDEEIGEGWEGVNGDRMVEGMRKRRAGRGEVPYEDRWEVDREALSRTKVPATTFRQSAQTHTDWVNAMLLCNLNQTVITASSDRTIRAWSPHSTSDPALVGRHRDYVRALAWAKYPSLLFSGALDRQLSIWDVTQPNPDTPLLALDMSKVDDFGGVGLEGERGSIYALGVDPAGKVLAAGTPERVVRLWDPRVGDKSIGKLIGHSDCVRSVIVSEDGRHMLTGSSDTTVKLWSLGEHRCLHTFNHHTSSVWALHSNHPNLERFYSGSRDGNLCVVDVEGCTDMSDAECLVLAREIDPHHDGTPGSKSGDEGIRSIVGMDDEFVWTATGSAEVNRWRDVGRRTNRLSGDGDDDGVAYHPDEPIDPPATTNQAFNKRLSVDGAAEPGSLLFRIDSRENRSVAFAPTPSPRAGITDSSRLSAPQRVSQLTGAPLASSIVSEASNQEADTPNNAETLNGIPYTSLVCLGVADSPYSFGFAGRSEDGHTLRSVASTHSVPRAVNGSRANGHDRARLEFEDREIASEAEPLRRTPDAVIAGRPGLVRSIMLNDRQHVLTVDTEGEVSVWNIIRGICVGRFAATEVAVALDLEKGVEPGMAIRRNSMEVLEMIKDRVEGETMVITWCQVDTKIGSLVVHLEEGRVFDAEVYADEMGFEGAEGIREDTRLNLGKWALANLFKGLIKAEEREVTATSPTTTNSSLPSMPRSPNPGHIAIERAPNLAPPHRARAFSNASATSAPSLNIPGLATPAQTPAVLPEVSLLSQSAPTTSGFQNFQALRTAPLSAIPQSPSSPAEVAAARGDYFSLRRTEVSPNRAANEPPKTPGPATIPETPVPSTPGGGRFMGKFKLGGKKKTLDTPMSTVVETKEIKEDTGPKLSEKEASQMHILDTVRAHPFHPPPPWEAPPLDIPPSTSLLISEESKDAGAWVVTYRSRVSSTETDMEPLEMNSPLWLLDYLFTSRVRIKEPVKLTFILEPVPGSGLKEMPEGTTRLSASRVLRARKIMLFIYEKLELGPPSRSRQGSMSTTARITALGQRRASGQTNPPGSGAGTGEDLANPEEMLELVIGETVVDPKITLATLKQYYGSGGDMLLNYRLRKN